jgi:hypothetical protein
MKFIKQNKVAVAITFAFCFGFMLAGGLFGLMGASYSSATINAPFQIQPVTNGKQTVALSSGCTLGADAGSTVDLSGGSVAMPGLNLNAAAATVPSGGTLSSASGSTVVLSGGTLTLPTIMQVNFAGSNGTSAGIVVQGSSSGQKVLSICDVTGGTGTIASGSGTATLAEFGGSIIGSGSLAQTSSSNLSGRVFSAILMQQGP